MIFDVSFGLNQMMGMTENRTFGSDSSTSPNFAFQRAPSKNMPSTYTPSTGGDANDDSRIISNSKAYRVRHTHPAADKGVDGGVVLARKILQRTRQKRVGEKEARDPKDGGCAVGDPVVKKLEALEEVQDVAAERLKGGVALGGPHGGDLARHERLAELLEVCGHDDEAFDGLEEV